MLCISKTDHIVTPKTLYIHSTASGISWNAWNASHIYGVLCFTVVVVVVSFHIRISVAPVRLYSNEITIQEFMTKTEDIWNYCSPSKFQREKKTRTYAHTKIYIYAGEKKNMIVETLSLEWKEAKKSRHETKFIFDYIYKVHGRIRWEYKISIEKQLPQFTIYNNANHVREAKWRK